MAKYLSMTSDRAGYGDDDRLVPAGTVVVYLGHVSGGMVRVRFADGEQTIMHPHCFLILRE